MSYIIFIIPIIVFIILYYTIGYILSNDIHKLITYAKHPSKGLEGVNTMRNMRFLDDLGYGENSNYFPHIWPIILFFNIGFLFGIKIYHNKTNGDIFQNIASFIKEKL